MEIISTGMPQSTSTLTPRARKPYCVVLQSLGRSHCTTLLHGPMRSPWAPRLLLHHPRRRISLKGKATGGASDGEVNHTTIDRRDVLLGLGAGAAAAVGAPRRALAAPIKAPDLGNCHTPEDLPEATTGATNCCPVYDGTGIVDFEMPMSASGSAPAAARVRPAAQLVDAEYVAKYERAVRLMKELPADDPRGFEEQWRVHCAYCDGAYDQVGFPDLEIQIHNCWLFFPWHRFYLYFHERILGKLLGDESFALPFWNWDAPAGMALPSIYANNNVNSSSPLYDPKRNPAHQPPFLLDLDYSGTDDPNNQREEQIEENLRIMYRQMVSNAKKPQLFLGQPYRAGDDADPGAGSIENVPHGTVHLWTGDPRETNQEDMGNFYSAARDPVFFAHHANIDRLWHLWRCRRQRSNSNNGGFDFADPEWLDAAFLFYDEEARLVRVRVRDCLDMASLGYAYQDVPVPWLDARPPKPASPTTPARALDALPATLDKTVRVAVARPRRSRSAKEKEEEEEVVVVEGIQVSDCSKFVKFDVLVNEPDDGDAESGMPGAAYCAGSVALTPHAKKKKKEGSLKTVARFGVCDLMDNIGADGDETVVVSLVPRCGGELVTVGGVSIGYAK